MNIKNKVTLQRLIGKVDNDFNIPEADWIGRAAAWIIDGLSQLNVLPLEYKTRKLEVSDKIAQFPCMLNAKGIKVYDNNGCEIPNINESAECSCNQSNRQETLSVIDVTNNTGINYMQTVNMVTNSNHNFVVDGNNIELNFDTDYITVKSLEVATYYDEYYDCEVPYIYDNGNLLEALSWYILFKYLSRGSKHPVFDLKSNNPATNPFVQWTNWRLKAINSVKHQLFKDKGWNNFLYNSTFIPRD